MTLEPAERQHAAQFNKQAGDEPTKDMAMLDQCARVKEIGEWKASLVDMSRCDAEVGSKECDMVVDGILAIAESSDDAGEVIDTAGASIAGMFGEFQSNALYNEILVRMLDRAYMVPGGCERLGAFFGGIKIDAVVDDKYAYFALDVVRVVLRYLFVRWDALRDSRQAALGACYDAMLRVAVRNGLDNLAETMRGADARAEYCGPGSGICKMAMLRISIYDKRDVPSNAEMLGVLDRYPMLKDVLGPGSVIDTKPLLTRLVHHISLNHLVAQEDHGWAYTAVYESNVRLGYWLGKIDLQHGCPEDGAVRRPGKATRAPAFAGPNTMVAIRFMVHEIADFWDLYGRIRGLVRGVSDPGGIYRAMGEQGGTRGAIKEMRDGLAAYAPRTFGEAAKKMGVVGLERLVLYAHMVLMFQDALYRTIPGRYRRRRLRDVRQLRDSVELDLAPPREAEEAGKAYSVMSVAFNGEKTQCGYVAMRDSLACMLFLYADFVDAVQGHGKDTLEGHRGFFNGAYNAKYVILEMGNFIEQYTKMGIVLKKDGAEFVPGVLKRRQFYREFRDGYAAHARMGGIGGMQDMAEENPGLISDVLRDVVEAGAIVTRLSGEFREYGGCAPPSMTSAEIRQMEERLDMIRRAAGGNHGGGIAEPNQEGDAPRSKAEVDRVLGIE